MLDHLVLGHLVLDHLVLGHAGAKIFNGDGEIGLSGMTLKSGYCVCNENVCCAKVLVHSAVAYWVWCLTRVASKYCCGLTPFPTRSRSSSS